MMGDNRDNSTDSRALNQVGYVPYQYLVGKVQIIYFSVQRGKASRSVRWDRALSVIH
jgi:signal peptidase I